MNFKVCNVAHPNSVNYNTCVFCAFEASDNPTNLKIALERQPEHTNLEVYLMNFIALFMYCARGKKVKVFMSGDYEPNIRSLGSLW